MNSSTLIGIVLLVVGVSDLLLGLLVVAPRLPEDRRPIVRLGFVGGAAVMIVLGALFLAGVLGN